jgi:autotransporter-associated beta strand protein
MKSVYKLFSAWVVLLAAFFANCEALAQGLSYTIITNVPNTEERRDYPLGPIGGQYRITDKAPYARVVAVTPGGPGAVAGLKVGDLIYGVFGKTLPPAGEAPNGEQRGDHHGVSAELGFAVDRAEGADGKLPLMLMRPGVGPMDLLVQLAPVGSYGASYPVASPKYDETYEAAVRYMHDEVVRNNGPDWYWAGWNGLILMGHPDWDKLTGANPYRISVNLIRDWSINSINSEAYAPTESVLYNGAPNPKHQGGSSNWGAGARLMFLAEYYQRTKLTDSPEMVARVRAALQRGTEMVANVIQWWKQPSLTGPNGYSPSGPDIEGMMSHGGVEGDYIHLGWGGGLNEPGGPIFSGMSFARRAGVDMGVRPRDGHYFGYSKDEFQNLLNTPGSPFYKIEVVEKGKELYDHTLDEKFRMYWRTRAYRNAGFSSPGDLLDGHTTYQFEGWNPGEAVGKTSGTILGMTMYQQDGGQLTSDDIDRLNRMKLFVSRNYMWVQNSHAYCVGAQAQHALVMPLLSPRQQRYIMDNWRFFFALGRDQNRKPSYFRSRTVNDNYLSEQMCMAVNFALPWTVMNNRISLLPAANQESLLVRFDNPDMRWPDYYSRHIRSTSRTLPMPLAVLKSSGKVQESSSYTKSWAKVAGPADVVFGDNDIQFGSDGAYKIKLTITQGTTVVEEPIDVIIQTRTAPEGFVAGSANYSIWRQMDGSSVASLTNDWRFPDFPDEVRQVSTTKGTVGGDSMGSRLSGLIMVPVTGTYRFYIASDDSSELRINTTGLDGSKGTVVAFVSSPGGYWVQPPAENYVNTANQRSVEFQLTEGQMVGFEARHKNQGDGNHLSVAWSINGSTPSLIPGACLARPVPVLTKMEFLVQPVSVRAKLGESVSLSVLAQGPTPATFQWRRNGVVLDGATQPVLELNNLSAGMAGEYDCAYTTVSGTLASDKAMVVITDVGAIVKGGLWREVYTGVSGESVTALTSSSKFPYRADFSEALPSLYTSDYGDNYGERWSGWLTPKVTGNYQFYIAADDQAELWLGTDDRQQSAVKIHEITSYCSEKQWSARGASANVPLEAGKSYYIEVRHKEGGGGDHCGIAWKIPGGSAPADGSSPIGAEFLTYRKGGLFPDTSLANVAPTFLQSPVTRKMAYAGTAYSGQTLDWSAADQNPTDIPTLVYSKISGPNWLTVASNGALSGTPATGDVGNNTFTIRVTDAAGLFSNGSLNIPVQPANRPPGFVSSLTRPDAVANASYIQTLVGQASDPDSWATLSFSKVSGPAWLNVSSDGKLTGLPKLTDVGNNTFRVRVTDEGGLFAESDLRITVQPASAVLLVNGQSGTGAVMTGFNRTESVPLAVSIVRGSALITKVTYRTSDGTVLGTSTAAPFNIVWENIPSGTYTVSATLETAAYGSITTVPMTLEVEYPPLVAARTLVATRRMTSSTLIGTMAVSVAPNRTVAGWSIVSGDPDNLFEVNGSGEIRVLKPELLPSPGMMALRVRAVDSAGKSSAVYDDGLLMVICNPPASSAVGVNEQRWAGGDRYTKLDWTSASPTYSGALPTFTTAQEVGDDYSRRLTGYIVPPVTGDYTFSITSDDGSRLYLSPDDRESNKEQIITFETWAPFQQWDRGGQSSPIRLQGGTIHYMEVHHLEGSGGDHVSVAWEGPGISRQPIPASVIFPPRVSGLAWTELTSPSSTDELDIYHSVTLEANVVQGSSTVTRVDFYSDGLLLGNSTASPYRFTWKSPTAGSHIVSAKVVTAAGTVNSQDVTIRVETPPKVETLSVVATTTMASGEVIGQGIATPAAGRSLVRWIAANSLSAGLFALDAKGNLQVMQPSRLPASGALEFTIQAVDNTGAVGTGIARVLCNPDSTRVGGAMEQRWAGSSPFTTKVWPSTAVYTGVLDALTTASNVGENYSRRVTGYLRAPVTGNYVFALLSDDDSRLFLSSDESSANLVQIVQLSGSRASGDWNNSVKSAQIPLQAGRLYSIELHHLEGGGADFASVGWQVPGGVIEPIPASAMSSVLPVSGFAWVGLNAPSPAGSYKAGVPITFSSTVVRGSSTMTAVQYYDGDRLIGSSAATPYSFTWAAPTPGSHVITARAVTAAGSVDSAPLRLSVETNTDPNVDADGDGFVTSMEMLLGFDPFDGASRPPSIYSGMVAWWRFEETSGTVVGDSSGNGRDGTAVNPSRRLGILGTALSLTGNQSVAFGTAPAIVGTGDFSISAWVKVSPGSPEGVVLQQREKDGSVDGWRGQYMLTVRADGTVRYMLQGDDGGQQFILTTTKKVNDGQWHHVLAQRQGTKGQVFIDGSEDAVGTTASKALLRHAVYMGYDGRDDNTFYQGLLDEVRIYSRALSSTEAQDLFSDTFSRPVGPTFGPAALVKTPAVLDRAYVGTIATDAWDPNTVNGDVLTFSKVTGPAWLSVASNGSLSGTPRTSDLGSNAFTVRVTDASGLSSDVTMTVVVQPPNQWLTQGGGSWSVGTNWKLGAAPSGSDQIADLTGLDLNADANMTLDGARTLGGVSFRDATPSHKWSLAPGSGGTLTLATPSPSVSPVVSVGEPLAAMSVVLAGTQGLVKTGLGTLVLSANNTYTGETVVEQGTLALVQQLGGFNSSVVHGSITVKSGATLALTNSPFGWGGGLTSINVLGGKVVAPSGLGAFGVVYTLAGGDISGAVSMALGGYNSVDGSVKSLASPVTSVMNLGGGITFRRDSGQANYRFNTELGTTTTGVDLLVTGNIAEANGACSLIKEGAGTLALNGAASYSGPTVINAGTLLVNGSIGSSSAVTVDLNGTLGGTGSVNGATTVNGTLAPGGSAIGKLTIQNTLKLAGKSVFGVSKTGKVVASDQIVGATSVSAGGELVITSAGDPLVEGDSMTLFNVAPTGSFSSVSLPTLPSYLKWQTTDNYKTLSVVSVGTRQANTIAAFSPIGDQLYIPGATITVVSPTASSGLPVSLSIKSGPASIAGNLITLTGGGTVVVAANQYGNATYSAAAEATTSFLVVDGNPSPAIAGALWREVYSNLNGETVADLTGSTKYPGSPDSASPLTSAATSSFGDSYGQRWRGLITPPVTGKYRFYVAGDDAVQVYLSTDSSSANKVKIVESTTWTAEKAWSERAPSAYISMEGGVSYYIEVLHKEGSGGDSCAVAWQREGTSAPTNGSGEIPGSVLSYRQSGIYNAVVQRQANTISAFPTVPAQTFAVGAKVTITSPTASSGLPVVVSVKSGPATIVGNTVTLTGAGTVVLAANQLGNLTYAAATEVTTSFQVAQGSQSISFPTISNAGVSSEPLALNATSTSGLPVSYEVLSGPATVNGSQIVISGTGTVQLRATQAGDANWLAAIPVSQSFTVAKGANVIAPFASISSQTYVLGKTLNFTVPTASSYLPVVVTVKSGPATLSGNTITLTGPGTVVLAANQAGNGNFLAASEVVTSFTVAKVANAISAFTAIPTQTYVAGKTVTITVPNASSGLAVSVSVKSGPATISGNTVTLTGAGTVVLAANQAGNDVYLPATEVTTSFSVQGAAAPALVSRLPAAGTPAVSVASDVIFEFDQEIVPGTGSIVLNGGTGDVRTFNVADAGQVWFRGKTVRLNPTADLLPNKSYSVQVQSGAMVGASGTPYAGLTDTTAFAFQTGDVLYAKPTAANGNTGGSGTAASPYASIGYATTKATPGSTIYVQDPGATLTRSYTLQALGSAAAPVVMKPAPGARWSYKFSGLNNFIIDGASYFTLEGFRIEGGSDAVSEYEIASNLTSGFWAQQTISALGGIAVNVKNGVNIVVRDNVFQHLQQKAVNIENGRYVEVTGNVIHNVATKSLSGGHAIMRQQGSGSFGTADTVGKLRWNISGNLIFNVSQRLYSWVPSKGYLNMTLDEGKPINIDETTDTEMAARIGDNVIAYAAIDSIRLKPTPNLTVERNSIFSSGLHADGITDANTLSGSNPFPGLMLKNNLIMTAPGSYGMEVNDGFPTAAATDRVYGNLLSGGIVNPAGLLGVDLVSGRSLFVDPLAGDFSAATGVPAGLGADPSVIADLKRKAQSDGIVITSDGWVTDHLKLTQTLLDAVPGLEDGVSGNETVFKEPATYGPSVKESGRKSMFFSVDGAWQTAKGVAAGVLSNGRYEVITPSEYSAWRDALQTAYPNYGSVRWGDSVLGQNKVFTANSLFVASIRSSQSYTRTVATGKTITLAGDLLVDFDGYTPKAGDAFDLIQAAEIVTGGGGGFGKVIFADGVSSAWTHSVAVVATSSGKALRLTINSGGTSTQQSQSIGAFAGVGSQVYGVGKTVTITPPSASSGLPVVVTVKSGPATIAGNVVTLTGAGAVVLAANQGGNSAYQAATEVTTSFTVSTGVQSITFPELGAKTVGDAAFPLGATASSGLAVAYAVEPSGVITVNNGLATIVAAGTVTIMASQAGNANWAAASPVSRTLVVNPATPASRRLAGQVQYYASTGGPVRGVTLTMTEGATRSAVSGDDGGYEMEGPADSAVAVTPSYATDVPIANGVTTADITLIRRHVLGLALLDSPYKVLAGDVNASESVTTADITLIRRLILGTASTFTAGLWRFVPSDEVIGDPVKPWTATRMRRYASLATGTLGGQDFKAIKLGDVNGSWKAPAMTAGSLIKSKSIGRLVVGKAKVAVGQAIEIPVNLEGISVFSSVQMTLSWDASLATYDGVQGTILGELKAGNVGLNRVNEGLLTLSWDHPAGEGIQLENSAELLRLKLKPKSSTTSGGVIRLLESPTPVEVADQGNVLPVSIEPGWFEFGGGGGTGSESTGLRFIGLTPDGGVVLEVRAPQDVRLALESSDLLGAWEEIETVTGKGVDQPIPLKPSVSAKANSGFWRLRIK